MLSGPTCTWPALLILLLTGAPAGASESEGETEPEPIPVELRSATGLTIVARSAEPDAHPGDPTPRALERLCTTPCTARLSAGSHELAIVRLTEPPLLVTPTFQLTGPSHLEIETISHATARRTGFWLMAIGIPLGVASTTIGLLLPACGDDLECQRWTSLPIWGGIGIASFSALLGIPLVTREDEAILRIAPTTRSVSLVGTY